MSSNFRRKSPCTRAWEHRVCAGCYCVPAITPKFVAQMTAAVALLGRLMDLAASLQIVRSNQFFVPEAGDRERCLRLADQIAELERDVAARKLPKPLEIADTIAAFCLAAACRRWRERSRSCRMPSPAIALFLGWSCRRRPKESINICLPPTPLPIPTI